MTWGRSDAVSNPSFTGNPTSSETAAFQTGVAKQFANGGSLSVSHNWNYLGTNSPGTLLGSAYTGTLGVDYRLPLLQGSGVDYTRIAGPARPGFGGITGVSQGVVIARINQDITVADFEIAVRNGIRDIENAYWDLYLAYRSYDTATVAHQSAYQTWRESQDRLEVGVLKPADELQARDRLYETKAGVETSLNQLYQAEAELRRLVGMPMNDGMVLVPVDEPSIAELVPDWRMSLTEALTYRTELRRQKWNIKSLQLQLQAARSLVRPQFDMLAGYDMNAYGDRLLGNTGAVSATGSPIRSGYDSLINQGLGTWYMGFQFQIPLGYRFTRAQVRSYELQVAKATAVLASQERNIAHDVATSIQDVTASYTAAQSNLNRLKAASRRVELLETEREVGTSTLDLVLRAQASVAAAESSYYQQLVNYNKAIVSLNLAKGTLLEQNGIYLSEGQWDAEAYCDAQMRAAERTHAKPNPHLQTHPPEFVSPGPAGTIELRPSTAPMSYESAPPESQTPVDATDDAGDDNNSDSRVKDKPDEMADDVTLPSPDASSESDYE
ncbi:MAG: TolC family protein [Planctomycetaceae bacterium]